MLDTAVLLLATITGCGMAAGVYHVALRTCAQVTDRRPLVTVCYPDGSQSYCVDLRMYVLDHQARVTVTAPVVNDIAAYAASSPHRFSFVIEHIHNDGCLSEEFAQMNIM